MTSLSPQLAELGIPLVIVVHERLGVAELRTFFKGECLVVLDEKREFFVSVLGNRWLADVKAGFALKDVQANAKRATAAGFPGNMKGEGRLLGGVLVVGPEDRGVVWQCQERVWGDHAPVADVLQAARFMAGKSTDPPPTTRAPLVDAAATSAVTIGLPQPPPTAAAAAAKP